MRSGRPASTTSDESEETVKVGDKDVACTKVDSTSYNCKDEEVKVTMWYSKDVWQLMINPKKNEKGGLVKMKMATMTNSLSGFGDDAKPKHDLPK